tara:strand:- start:987 stop:7331 length:6345 start_codon:yes stop_codon:yes gene_type:complete
MPELNRSFIKGKMNKDLDERLLPPNEYRDAMNISVSTSEDSDVGAIENLLSTKFLDNTVFKKPRNYKDGSGSAGRYVFENVESLYTGAKNIDRVTFAYSPAQVVGVKEDTTTDRIYYFVKDAAGPVEGASSDGTTFYAGIRSDCIFEATPSEAFYRLPGQSILPVFTDVYEVRLRIANYTSSDTINGANNSGVDYNGIEIGMKVDAVDANGNSVWLGQYDDVEVTGIAVDDFQDTQSVDASSTNHVQITTNKATVLTSAQFNAGVVLVFTKPKILNFESGTEALYTDANGSEILTPTPTNIITAIDIFDGMLFFTDGRNEPKKINIERCLKGTISGSNPGGIFNTTHLMIPTSSESSLDNNFWNAIYNESADGNANVGGTAERYNTPMKLEHVSVMRPAPITPLKVLATDNSRNTDFLFASTTAITTGAINLGSSGLNATVGNEVAINTTQANAFAIGDDVLVTDHDDAAIFLRGTIVDLTGNTSSDSITVSVTSIEGTLDDANEDYTITRVASEDEKLFKENFVRFAYRYVYPDGEVSSLSPFTNPVFLPRTYSYDSKEAFNKGMENNISFFKLQNFAPANMPLDAVSVDILYKEDISPNIYFVRNIKGNKLLSTNALGNNLGFNDSEFDAEGFICETLLLDSTYVGLGANQWVTAVNKGSISMDAEQFGSTIPSNQLLRSYDNVPKTAKCQAISANRLIYANYTQAYDLTIDEVNSDGGRKTLRPEINLAIRNLGSVSAGTPKESIKSQRTYQVGVVYKDFLGRETAVLIDKNSSLTSSIDLSDQHLKLQATILSLAPNWATHYKFYIKETSNEYYNLVLHRSYNFNGAATSLGEDAGDVDNKFVYLAFNSSDRNKVQEGDFLSIKKARDGGATTYKTVANKIKVLDIKNEAPDGTDPAISQTDKEGKFFVKVKNITNLLSGNNTGELNNSNNPTGTAASPATADAAIFEVLPSPDRDVNLYYEASQCYPIQLTEETIHEWVNPGDEVFGFDYVANAASSVKLTSEKYNTTSTNYDTAATLFVNTITFDHAKQAWALTFKSVNGDAPNAPNDALGGAFTFQNDSYLGTLHFKQKDGSINVSEIHFENDTGSYNNSASGADNTTVFIKKFTHPQGAGNTADAATVVLPWFNCYSFGNGVESDRIRDDFNAPTIANGVKASTVFENYKEEKREHGFIFSGIYNSTSGINRLNQFIQAEPITKDLNPVYGSIQKIVARDTDIVALCEDKVLKVLANKNALFNADGNTNVTSNTQVLGTAIPFSGEYGVSNNPESVVVSGYRVYFTDKFRGAVLRLSNDGLTPISEYGMSDYFKDTLKEALVCIGSFNDRLGEYDLSIHSNLSRGTTSLSNTQPNTKTVDTISFNEKVNGWSSFKSYAPEAGVSLDGEYYTFKFGNIYEHSIESFRNSFYGIVAGVRSSASAGATVIPVNSPINPNIKAGDKVFHSNISSGNSYVSTGIIPEDTTVVGVGGTVAEPTITISNATTGVVPLGVIVTHGTFSNSTVTTIFNDSPSSVKSFQYLKYEGTQSRVLKPDVVVLNSASAVTSGASITLAESNDAIAVGQTVFLTTTGVEVGTVQAISGTALTLTAAVAATVGSGASLTFADQQYYNNFSKNGWFASSVETDLQSGKVLEFIKKEGKWFNYFKGVTSSFTNQTLAADASGNIDSQEFSVQGIARTTSRSFAGDTTPGSTFSVKVEIVDQQDVSGQANVYNIDSSILINNLQSIANSNDTATGTVTFTPSQSPTTTINLLPTENNGISAEDFFVTGGTSGDTSDAASGTTFTHGTNGITLNTEAGNKPLKAVTFTNSTSAYAPDNFVIVSIVFADTTVDANLSYQVPIAMTLKNRSDDEDRPNDKTNSKIRGIHNVKCILQSYNHGGQGHFFAETTGKVNGAVTSDATVVLDELPVGTGVTGNTLGFFSVGDTVTGAGVAAGTTVASITNATTFELSAATSIADNTDLSFSGITAGSNYTINTTLNTWQTGGTQDETLTTVSTGTPFINTQNLVNSFRISCGTNRGLAVNFINSGYDSISISPASHAPFIFIKQTLFQQNGTSFPPTNNNPQGLTFTGSNIPITLFIEVFFNPPPGFVAAQATTIYFYVKATGANSSGMTQLLS